MFNLVKWAYNLGVKHERRRIADYLTIQAQINRDLWDDLNYELGKAQEKGDAARADEVQRAIDVQRRVQIIVDGIFEQQYQAEPTKSKSVMFPEEEK